jgi:hypothetical protein
MKKETWLKEEYQGKSQKQVEDSCKIITWGTIVILIALIASMLIKH